ncbi:uncharacterized protein [Musca autumnalis]|uniref:uncharacterized protein n=1 Tax=Musca autumnalis TaxID=221902 RepID=UPI003CF012DA
MHCLNDDESPYHPFNYTPHNVPSDVNAKVAVATSASAETNSPPGEQTASTAIPAVIVDEHSKAADNVVKATSSTPKASSKRCKSKRQCGVDNCKMPHNSLLHNNKEQQQLKRVENKQVNENNNNNHSVLFHVKERVLFKYIPVTLFGNDKSLNTYALIDEGASCSLIEIELVDQLGVDGPSEELCLQWTGEITHIEETSITVSLHISDRKQTSKFLLKNIRTVTKLDLPVQTLSTAQINNCEHFNGLPIIPYTAVRARIIIGLDNAKLCVPIEVKEVDGNELIATRCKIGWGVYGRQQSNSGPVHRVMHICSCNKSCSDLDEQLKYFFSLDAVGVAINQNPLRSVEDERAKAIMDKTTKYLELEQRWETGLLWKHNEVSLPNFLSMARRRQLCLEAKMKRDVDLHKFLVDKIREYEEKGYVRKLEPHEIRNDNKSWYIPMFTVKNKNKNKTRIVWDAAAAVENVSLNTVLMKGPNLLKSLVGVLIRFRERPFAICGDIREMYHQIKLKEDEQCFQQFLWREGDSAKPIDVYVMTVLTFGASCSPSLANYVKNRNAERFTDKFPCAVNSILSNTFVDDWLQSVDSEEEMLKLAIEVRSIHKDGGFEMRNWLSNSEKVLNVLDDRSINSQKAFEDPEDYATNFRGACRVLLEEVEKISSAEVERKYPTIKWEFIPPASPHMGGAWERMVRSVKSVSMDILPKRELREKFLRAALADVENIINSRPLTYIPLESTDLEALTPNHFLLGSSSGIRERDYSENSSMPSTKMFSLSNMIANEFWKRWIREYLPCLTRRTKWFNNSGENLQVGDVVIIVDDNAKRNEWLKGMVIDVPRGKDDVVRSAVVKTKNGLLTRPVVKLAKLDVE